MVRETVHRVKLSEPEKGLRRAYKNNVLLLQYIMYAVYFCILTEAFRHYSTAVLGVHNPVVVFQSVHDLQYGAHPANGVVDGHRADELR